MKINNISSKIITVPLRMTAELDSDVAKAAKAIGESKQTITRLAIKAGLPVVLDRLRANSEVLTETQDTKTLATQAK